MRFEILDDGSGTPLFKSGTDRDGSGLEKWGDIGDVIEIPTDSKDPDERTQASRWMRGNHQRLRAVPGGRGETGPAELAARDRSMAGAGRKKQAKRSTKKKAD